MIRKKLISSLEKPFIDGYFNDYKEIKKISIMKNEILSLQLLITDDNPENGRRFVKLIPDGVFAPYTTQRSVENIPSAMPCYPGKFDSGFLSTKPGLYPDLLKPMQMNDSVSCVGGQLHSVWFDIDTNGEIAAGNYNFTVIVCESENDIQRLSVSVEIINSELPEQELRVTQWFHCDCLADYYNVEIFSERHWEIIENFVRVAVKNGINMLLTPIFTPPLDTHIGGERPTVQLVGVKKTIEGYEFDFTLLDRWIEMCNRCGVKYLEISHLFTQWGAEHAPKIIAETPNGIEKIFGWDTDASGVEYSTFLRSFIKEFLSHMKARGDDSRCFFHISDEPNEVQLEQYLRSKSTIIDMLEGYPVMDALSNYEFYRSGVVKMPIAASNHIEPFIEGKVEPLWTYYCCGQSIGTSNRFFAMPGARTRFIGVQMFKYNIYGFLQWGYNFYYNQGSYDFVDPYLDSTGNYFVPSGDTYSVYPAHNGEAYESVRIKHFAQAIDDLRAMKLAESYIGHDAVVSVLEEICGEIKFSHCVCESEKMHIIREAVNNIIKENSNKQ